MNGREAIHAIQDYIHDLDNAYALMVTGEWGCGKTYFIEHKLTEELRKADYSVILASAYGAKDAIEICEAIQTAVIEKIAIGPSTHDKESRKDALTKFVRDTGIAFVGKEIRKIERKVGVDLHTGPLGTVNLLIGNKTLLVIDDIERCDMNPLDLLGFVDHLTAGCDKKVVLVCNESEWLKRDNSKETRKIKQLIEKTVWRKCHFEPSIRSVVKGIYGKALDELYPNAADDLIEALEENRLSNIRSLMKIRPVLQALRQSEFFDETTDEESTKMIFKETCGFAAMAAAGRYPTRPAQQNDSRLEGGVIHTEHRKYETLDFIGIFFERSEGIDPEYVRDCLERYRNAYYPQGRAARDATRSIDKLKYLLFRDDEAGELIDSILAGILPDDESQGLSIDRYPETLRTVKHLEEDHSPIPPKSSKALVEAMKKAIDLNPDAAIKTIFKDALEWQTLPFDSKPEPALPQLTEIDELREHALKSKRSRDAASLNEALREDPNEFANKLYALSSKQNGSLNPLNLIASLEIPLLSQAMAKMDLEKIRLVRMALASKDLMDKYLYSLGSEDREVFSSWANRLKNEIDHTIDGERCEYCRKRYLEIISHELGKRLSSDKKHPLDDASRTPETSF